MEVKVLFFGVLKEVTNVSFKYYRDIKTLGDLKHMINDDFPEIAHYNFRVALNNVITDQDSDLSDRDEVALMPPFAGG
jgi:sulfur-carrier protein